MQIIDDTHIKMMMAEPNSSTLESVGFFVYYMSPKALENPSSLDAATCGTGPFQLSEFENNATPSTPRTRITGRRACPIWIPWR